MKRAKDIGKVLDGILGSVRDPFVDNTKTGIFRNHSCWKCRDGEKPCAQGRPGICEYPHARND